MHGDHRNERQERFIDRPLPSSDEAERCVLGGVLIDNALIEQAAEKLRPEDFYSPLHRRIFSAMMNLHGRSSKIDAVLIAEELKADGPVENIGGILTIANLAHGIPAFTSIERYADIVRDKSNLRQLVRTCGEISNQALDESDDAATVFAAAQEKINNLCLQAESGDLNEHFIALKTVIDRDVIAALEGLRYGNTSKIKTGFAPLDASIGGGITPSDVLLLAADTGAGKSALALQIARQIAEQGIPTAFLAGEMTNCENTLRLLSQISGFTNLNWLTHISENDHTFLVDWANSIKHLPLHFEHQISDMQTLRTHLASIVRRQKVKVLVIDYIQLFKMEKVDKRKRNERIAEASQEVKRLANELDIAIIEVAQFNREGAKSSQAGIHDLEGSGQLEKDASLIFILELGDEEFQDMDNRKYREAKIRIKKGRNVGHGEVDGRFYGRSVQFRFE